MRPLGRKHICEIWQDHAVVPYGLQLIWPFSSYTSNPAPSGKKRLAAYRTLNGVTSTRLLLELVKNHHVCKGLGLGLVK